MSYSINNQPASPADPSLSPPLPNAEIAIVSNPKKRLAFFLLFLAVVFLLSLFFFFTKSQKPPANVAAVVNGTPILKSDQEKLSASQNYYFTKIFPTQTKENVSPEFVESLNQTTLDFLILEKLLSQYLEQKGVTISDDEVRQKIQTDVVDPNFGGDWTKYEQSLTASATDLENQMHSFRRDLLIEKVIQLENIKPYDFDKWYADLKAKSQISQGQNVNK